MCGSDIYEWYEIENKAEFEELVRIKHHRSFSSSSCRLKWTAVKKAVKGTRPAKVTISIILPPAQCIILNNSAKLNKLMVVAPNL
jgi:hypothetical protein